MALIRRFGRPLRAFWTEPQGGQSDALVDEFVEIDHFHLTRVGVDGLRIDTAKRTHPVIWDAFTGRMMF